MWNLIRELGRRGYRFPCFPSSMSDVTGLLGSQLEGIVRDCSYSHPASCWLAFVANSEAAPEARAGEIFPWKHFVETNIALTWNWEPSEPLRRGMVCQLHSIQFLHNRPLQLLEVSSCNLNTICNTKNAFWNTESEQHTKQLNQLFLKLLLVLCHRPWFPHRITLREKRSLLIHSQSLSIWLESLWLASSTRRNTPPTKNCQKTHSEWAIRKTHGVFHLRCS